VPDLSTPNGVIELLEDAAEIALGSSDSLLKAKALASIASSAARALQALNSEEFRLSYQGSGGRSEPAVFTLEIPSLRKTSLTADQDESTSTHDLRLVDHEDSTRTQETNDV
jgi:hypothetical protein